MTRNADRVFYFDEGRELRREACLQKLIQAQKRQTTLEAFGHDQIAAHTYLWGNEGLYSKEYDVNIYVADHLVTQKLGIAQKDLNGVIEPLDNTYKGTIVWRFQNNIAIRSLRSILFYC